MDYAPLLDSPDDYYNTSNRFVHFAIWQQQLVLRARMQWPGRSLFSTGQEPEEAVDDRNKTRQMAAHSH